MLLRNSGDGATFSDTTSEAGAGVGTLAEMQRVSWAAFFFDYDNDGDEDLYVVSGFLEGGIVVNPQEQPNVLLQNSGDGTFADVSPVSGANDAGFGRGGGYLDFNNDGCLDLFVATTSSTRSFSGTTAHEVTTGFRSRPWGRPATGTASARG